MARMKKTHHPKAKESDAMTSIPSNKKKRASYDGPIDPMKREQRYA